MLFVRLLTAAVATAALFGALWVSSVFQSEAEGLQWASASKPPLADKPIGDAFAQLAKEEYFTAEFTDAQGKTSALWGAADGKLRFAGAEPGLYSVVDRDREWRVDEPANRATTAKAEYHYRRESVAALNPWRLMNLEPEQGTEASYQQEDVTENNRLFLVSQFQARFRGEPVNVEARIDKRQMLPRELTIWPREKRGALPLARFHLIQAGAAGDDTKFKVATTLTADGRIGKVIDSQGLVTMRALASSRWTPVGGTNALLQPGDWLRTDNRGANAVTVQLAPQTKLILGPGTLIELPKPDQLRVNAGVVQVAASEKTPVTITGPDGKQQVITGKEVWQVTQNKLAKLAKDPVWLQGYAGQIPQETLGSLVALVDGRNVNLSVGYHKVTVDIRDQIARTTIEESFVNHTNSVLEGQFYFPLPQDASISGFGMWIGDKLVEADIVEKGRAREIYETILREKRDPGLLEWTGGNIFKAHVYPIPGQSEKRIKITYTQVLPLVGDSFRYSYALQSDLLKQNPLRQLELAVTIHSTQPLQRVQSPTHGTRNQQTPHSARIEFSAQNYTPTRDFEVVTTLATRSRDLTVIPHQRGENGFFMLLLQPPNHSSAFTRDLVNDGKELELLILADTSASMDRASRTRQAEVIGALLATLAPQDKFNLATCDVDCLWAFEKSSEADPAQIKKARDILERRRSAGWTNLQRGWESALKQASPGAHIIYVGDGIVTRGSQDLAGDMQAIKSAAAGKNVLGHAIAVSSSFESQILKAIAAVGGGSMRNAAGEVKPQQIAHDLLVEATRPSLRNIQISFRGIATAAVYPPTLPNLPAGTQQVVLGRYLPKSGVQQGEVIVTGDIEGKPVAFRAALNLPEAPAAGTDDDASFIPRLWARLHLDELLAQGSSQQIQDEIISLSEEYHLITPYTSLLVLETDADRERFKVKKRFQMRDGERFFHQGRKEANYALIQQQIQLAQAWRQDLRQKLLSQLSSLGRDANQLPSPRTARGGIQAQFDPMIAGAQFFLHGRLEGGGVQADFDPLIDLITSTVEPDSWAEPAYTNASIKYMFDPSSPLPVSGGGGIGGQWDGTTNGIWVDVDGPGSVSGFETDLSLRVGEHFEFSRVNMNAVTWNREQLASLPLPALLSVDQSAVPFDDRDRDYSWSGNGEVKSLRSYPVDGTLQKGLEFGLSVYESEPNFPVADYVVGLESGRYLVADGEGFFDVDGGAVLAGEMHRFGRSRGYFSLITESNAFHDRRTIQQGRQPLLPVPVPYRLQVRKPQKIESTWPAEAVALLKTLRLEDDLRQLAGGLSIERQDDSQRETRQLYSKTAWLSRGDERRDSSPLLVWCDDKERGNQSLAFEIALVRKSDAQDLQFLPGLLNEGAYHGVDELLPDYEVKLEKPAENRVLLIAKASDLYVGGHEEYRWLIDTEKRIVLEVERRDEGKVASKTKYDQFVQRGGRWLATVMEHQRADGKVTGRVTLKIGELTPERFQEEFKSALRVRERAITFNVPLPKVVEAEKSIAAGPGTLEDRLALIARHYGRNQLTEALTQLDAAEKLAPGKAGWQWLRLVLLEESRRHEEVKQLLSRIADRVAGPLHPSAYGIVERLRQISLRVTGGNEQLALVDQLQSVYRSFAMPFNGEKEWLLARLQSLANAGRSDEHRELQAQLAKKYRDDLSLQQQYVSNLRSSGEIAAAFAWIEGLLAPDNGLEWEEYEQSQLRGLYCEILESEGRYADAAKYAQDWITRSQNSHDGTRRVLAYLVLSGQEKEAFNLAQQWLDQFVPPPGKPLEMPASNKVQAAVELLIGEGRNINRTEMDPKYLPRLEKLLLQFVASDDAHHVAMKIWNDNDFRNSDGRGRVLKIVFDRLVKGAATLPLAQVQRLHEIAFGQTSSPEQLKLWKQVQQALERRWAAERRLSIRAQYRDLIWRISGIADANNQELVYRRFLAGAFPKEKDLATRQLFDHLLSRSWSKERETETLQMIDQLAASLDADSRLAAHVKALYEWTDTLETRRRDYLNGTIKRPDKMKRDELEKLHNQYARQAREEISQRLASAALGRKDKNDPFARWLLLEHLTLEIRLERKLPAVADQLWQLLQPSLDRKPVAKTEGESDEDEINFVQLGLEAAWQQRVITSLLNLAARPDAPAVQVARLMKLVEEQRQQRLKAKNQPPANFINWQQLQYELLVARDQPRELLQALENYITVNDNSGHWRRLKARVLAELNRLEAAVQVFEELESKDLLGGGDYRSLATWYHALDEKQKHEAAQVKVYRQEQAWQLDRRIRGELSRWQRSGGPLPEELNPQVLLMFEALLKTSDSPANYLGTLRNFYEVNHDTRLLHALAKALPGHTAERVYPMLSDVYSVLAHVEHEATIDELLEGLEGVRKTCTTPLDHRALDLLEVLAHRRAAELQNGAAPHIVAAIAALQRAEKREWLPGEAPQMGQFLAALGVISAPALAAEQVQLLERLTTQPGLTTDGSLQLASSFAALEWTYGRQARAIDLLTIACQQYRTLSGGKVNQTALSHWFQIADWQMDLGQFITAEQLLTNLIPQTANHALAQQVTVRRFALTVRAVREGALTSLGRGEPLYRAALARLRADIANANGLGEQVDLTLQVIELFRAAHDAKIASAAQDLLKYSQEDYPPILQRKVNGYENSVNYLSDVIATVAGPKEGIRFLLDRADNEPSWAKYQGNDAWSRWSQKISSWREIVATSGGKLDELEPRLLKFVVAELKRDLRTRGSRGRALYHLHNSYPWRDKFAAFATAAEEVLKESPDSGAAVMYIADYLFYGIERRDRAIEIMLAAYRRKLLDDSQQAHVVYLLHEANRYAESIPILESFLKRFPLNLSQRCQLMTAYFQTKQPAALARLLKQTHDLFHLENRWNESVMWQLGDTCRTCELYEPAVEYLKEAIAAHATNRTGKPCKFADVVLSQYMGDDQLSTYYQSLARSYAGLKNTPQAVDAASSAIVVWTRRHGQRQTALATLREVLQNSPDLNAYVKVLDQETKDSGQDRPIVRKILGEVFQAQSQFKEAIAQYQAAVQLSPGDAELHAQLIECFDALEDNAGAIAQSFDSLELNRRNFDLWHKLGERLETAMQPDEAERARTSLAEVAPGETEGLVKLAETRESQKRLREALEQWQQVGQIRKLEPTGLLNAARLQLALKQKEAAAESIKQLEATTWPERFQDELRQKLPELKKGLSN